MELVYLITCRLFSDLPEILRSVLIVEMVPVHPLHYLASFVDHLREVKNGMTWKAKLPSFPQSYLLHVKTDIWQAGMGMFALHLLFYKKRTTFARIVNLAPFTHSLKKKNMVFTY